MSAALEEIEKLADDILADIELNRISLSAVMLKCARLARLLKDENHRLLFAYEAGGYPSEPTGIPAGAFELGRLAGRVKKEVGKDGTHKERMSGLSVEAWEQRIAANKAALAVAADPNVSIASSNPNQSVFSPMGNKLERKRLADEISENAKCLAKSRSFAYEYASTVLYQARFSEAAVSIFDRTRARIDLDIVTFIPTAAQKTDSIGENLASENPEDWANAVHSCRRLLQSVADQLYPACADRTLTNGKSIKLGSDNYINRLIAFIEERNESGRYQAIVGSTLAFIGERLDAVFQASQKGSHAEIASRDEAERYVIYTFLTVGDILALRD